MVDTEITVTILFKDVYFRKRKSKLRTYLKKILLSHEDKLFDESLIDDLFV